MASLVILTLAVSASTAFSVPFYPPEASNVNNLTLAITGSGRPGIFNSSHVGDKDYGIYNWCNMPHVRQQEYRTPSKEYQLKYVELIHRHHKRTPYASNVLPSEDGTWDCTGEGAGFGARNPNGKAKHTALVQWDGVRSSVNPFNQDAPVGFPGSNCQFPQITSQGLEDSMEHGKDLAKAYRKFLPKKYNKNQIVYRVSNNVITSQVASGLIPGMFPDTETVNVEQQASEFDSLAPGYRCPTAESIKNIFNGPNTPWSKHLEAAADVYAQLRKVTDIPPGDSGGFHASFDHYFDNMSAKQCHQKALPCSLNDPSACVSQELADKVYRLGNWEYSYQWRDTPNSALYSALHYGAFMLELKSHLEASVSGSSPVLWMHNIAHDGSMASLLSILQISQMVWPGMGSEVVFELYEKERDHFIRVLWSGQPMKTSSLGVLDMVPLERFLGYIDEMVGSGSELYAACHA